MNEVDEIVGTCKRVRDTLRCIQNDFVSLTERLNDMINDIEDMRTDLEETIADLERVIEKCRKSI